jgi:hypothetical protein
MQPRRKKNQTARPSGGKKGWLVMPFNRIRRAFQGCMSRPTDMETEKGVVKRVSQQYPILSGMLADSIVCRKGS